VRTWLGLKVALDAQARTPNAGFGDHQAVPSIGFIAGRGFSLRFLAGEHHFWAPQLPADFCFLLAAACLTCGRKEELYGASAVDPIR